MSRYTDSKRFWILNIAPRVKSIALSSDFVITRRLLPAGLLAAYAVAFASRALGGGLSVFDDHPGQLYRLWHVLSRGPAPWAWNTGWWTGYPELQFYPPGFAYLGALAHAITLGRLAPETVYQVLLWLAWMAPGATSFLLLARLLPSPWLALPGAFVALTLSAGTASGVDGGVRVGMAGARMAAALLPLVVLALGPVPAGAARARRLAPLLVAAVALVHPAMLPAAAALVLLAARLGAGTARRRLLDAGWTLGVAALLTAFWSVPLLARVAETRPLAWGHLALGDAFARPLVPVLVGLAVLAAMRPLSPLEAVVARFPWVMTAVVAVDALVLEPLGVRWLPADRVADGAWVAFTLAAGLGAGRALAALGSRLTVPGAAMAAVGAAAVLGLPGETLTVWPRLSQWPTWTPTVRGIRLAELWRSLETLPPGRVLFVRSAVPLAHGTEWYRPHSHLTALTPLVAGRAIVNGTFTHPSPVAAVLYAGPAARGPIRQLVERLDGHSLFGVSLADLDGATLDRLANVLAVTVVVAVEDDATRLRALEESATFVRRPAPAPFILYARDTAAALPAELTAGRWRVRLEGEPGAWVRANVAYYPLWTATANGRAVDVRRGAMNQLEVRLPEPKTEVELVYRPGAWEKTGLALTALALPTLLVLPPLMRRRRQD